MSKNLKNSSFSLQLIDSDSLDQVFRYDDRLILGKRTNKVLQRKGNRNGYYDVQMLTSHDSTNSIDYISNKQWMNIKVNEQDIRKNEKMIKQLQTINLEVQNFNSSQYEFQNFENFQDSNQEIQIDDVQGQKEKLGLNSIKTTKQLSQSGLHTIEKSKIIVDEDVDKEKSTKSQKRKTLNKIEEAKLLEQKKLLGQKKLVEQKKLIEEKKLIKEKQQIEENRPVIMKKATHKRKKLTRYRQSEQEEEQEEPQTIKVIFSPIKIQNNEIYQPQGFIGQSRYPARLHVQPLRYWLNQKRSYTGGALSHITLMNDKQGRKVRRQLMRQGQ